MMKMNSVQESHFHHGNENEFPPAKVISISVMKMSLGCMKMTFGPMEMTFRLWKWVSAIGFPFPLAEKSFRWWKWVQGGGRKSFPFPHNENDFLIMRRKSLWESHFHFDDENEFCWENDFSEMTFFHHGNEFFPSWKWVFPLRDENEMTFPGQLEKMTFRKWLFSIMEMTFFHHGNEFISIMEKSFPWKWNGNAFRLPPC